jgi:hypothetical protein
MASPPHPDPAWQRLGDLLIKRRIDLDHRYAKRTTFCAERDVDYRVISDIEAARRPNFSRATLIQIENAYQLAAGNIGRIIQGGDMEPLEPATRVSKETPAPAAPPQHLGEAIRSLRQAIEAEAGNLPDAELQEYWRQIRAMEEELLFGIRQQQREQDKRPHPLEPHRRTGT